MLVIHLEIFMNKNVKVKSGSCLKLTYQFSFHPVKHIAAGGRYVNNEKYTRLINLRTHGIQQIKV